MSTEKYYTIKITGGTSPGSYTIYLNTIFGTVATRYPELTPATNLSLPLLQAGVTIKTNTTPNSIFLYNTYCENNLSLLPPVTITYESFCLTFDSRNLGGVVYKTFIPNGLVGGYPSWKDDTLNSTITITWDATLNPARFVINNYQPGGTGNVISSKYPTNSTSNPPENWQSVGGINTVGFSQKLGNCNSLIEGNFKRSVNQPTCICDGSIIFDVDLDNPPFSYSIDNGVTYSSSPIFTNLCSGTYILAVLDSIGVVHLSSEIIKTEVPSTTYTISLYTTNPKPVNNNVSLANTYETKIVVTPPLPNGTTITFDLIHNNNFYSSPNSGTSILTTSTLVYKNSNEVLLTNTSSSVNQSVNTAAGCQLDYVYQSNISDVWSSLTITNSDTITISTSSRVDKTTTGKCVVGYSNDNYSISNPVISGCDCCSMVGGQSVLPNATTGAPTTGAPTTGAPTTGAPTTGAPTNNY